MYIFEARIYIHICIFVYICIHICIHIYTYVYVYTHLQMYTYIYMCMWIFLRSGTNLAFGGRSSTLPSVILLAASLLLYVRVCVCVCVWERTRERERLFTHLYNIIYTSGFGGQSSCILKRYHVHLKKVMYLLELKKKVKNSRKLIQEGKSHTCSAIYLSHSHDIHAFCSYYVHR